MSFSITRFPEFENHELVQFGTDGRTGLRTIIAIHNTNLGPAVGGTRFWRYRSEGEALTDVLRLSRSMTYKCALAGVPYGGGKGVIIADQKKPKTRELIHAYAAKVDVLKGHFLTGEDVGIDEDDVKVMVERTPYIIGRPGNGGDPSPWAALGVFQAIRAALKAVYGSETIAGKTFAIKGLGKVGMELCHLLYREGGSIVGADINPNTIRRARRLFPKMKFVQPAAIHHLKVDVFAPCALGGDINSRTISQLRCDIVCGGANNQLATARDGIRLHRADILYIPDYLANAGGLINVVAELAKGGYNRRWVLQKTKAIRVTAKKIIELAMKRRKPTSMVADRLAESIFSKKKNGNGVHHR